MIEAEYQRKVDAAFAQLRNAGIWLWNGMPHYFRLLRRLGFKPRPPGYEPFSEILVSAGLFCAVFWGVGMHFITWHSDRPVWVQVISSGIFGFLFSGFVAMCNRYVRSKHNLTAWDAL